MDSDTLLQLGGSPERLHSISPGEQLARVMTTHRGAVDVLPGDVRLRVPGEMSVTTGDFVTHDGEAVLRVLERRSVLRRQSASASVDEQLLAANVDVAFLVTSMNRDFNDKRLIRLHAAVWLLMQLAVNRSALLHAVSWGRRHFLDTP